MTDAQPSRIKRVFRSARIIGRRFRLVHVYAGPNIFEVSTFRSIANGTIGNEFGTIDEDAHRRDFSLNALYFDPHDSTLVDYVGGFNDIWPRYRARYPPQDHLQGRRGSNDPLREIRFHDRVQDPVQAEARAQAGLAPLGRSQPFAAYRGIPQDPRFGLFRKDPGRPGPLRLAPPHSPGVRRAHGAESVVRRLSSRRAGRARRPCERSFQRQGTLGPARPLLEGLPRMRARSNRRYAGRLSGGRARVEAFLSPLNPPRVELEAAVLVVFKRRGISPMQRPRKWLNDRGDFRAADSPRKDMGRRGVPLRQPEKPAALLGEAAPWTERERASLFTQAARRREGAVGTGIDISRRVEKLARAMP